VAVVKNIPENNQRLLKIKHLVKIEPIVFPFGEPSEKDINYSFLKENGECVVIKNIDVLESRLQATEAFEKDKRNLDGDVLKRYFLSYILSFKRTNNIYYSYLFLFVVLIHSDSRYKWLHGYSN
jgi:hypothetical protein